MKHLLLLFVLFGTTTISSAQTDSTDVEILETSKVSQEQLLNEQKNKSGSSGITPKMRRQMQNQAIKEKAAEFREARKNGTLDAFYAQNPDLRTGTNAASNYYDNRYRHNTEAVADSVSDRKTVLKIKAQKRILQARWSAYQIRERNKENAQKEREADRERNKDRREEKRQLKADKKALKK